MGAAVGRRQPVRRESARRLIRPIGQHIVVFIYGLIDPRTSMLRYVGQTTDLTKRLSRHCHPRNDDRSHRSCWLRGILASGRQPIMVVLDVLDEVSTREAATVVECFWIASLRAAGADLVNDTDGGDGGPVRRGQRNTAEHNARIAATHRGKKASDETRAVLLAAQQRRRRRDHPIRIRHGTVNGYRNGCRCQLCKSAKMAAMRAATA